MRCFPAVMLLLMYQLIAMPPGLYASSDQCVAVSDLRDHHFHATDWNYRTEGGRHLILEYTGKNPVFESSIMRIKKPVSWADDTFADYPDHLFIQEYIKPYARKNWFPEEKIVTPGREFYQSIFEQSISYRPKNRIEALPFKSETQASIQTDIMSLSPDGITVEIKPKSGIIPNSIYISPQNQIKKEHIPFTLMQLFKLTKGKTQTLSAYNPADLYSKQKKRIEQSLRALFRHPQNNLKLYKNGVWIDSTEIQKLEEVNSTLYHQLIEDLSVILIQDPVLDFLKQLQSLDTIDTEGAWTLINPQYTKYFFELSDADFWKPGLWNPVSDPKRPEDLIVVATEKDQKKAGAHPDLSREQIRSLLQQYLIAAAAKDCSLLIHIFKNRSQPGKAPDWSLSVVDIGKKSVKKIPRNFEKDYEIVSLWNNTINESAEAK